MKETEPTKQLITKAKRGFQIRWVLSVIAWSFFSLSVIVKLCINKGLVSWILGFNAIQVEHYSFFSPGAFGETAKTVGVFSLFVVWIYAELGKSELGRRYTELLPTFCKHYHFRALSYILAILACVFIAKSNILESASIAMTIAALGLWDQALVLASFIFNPSVRKTLAVQRWEETFKKEKNGSCDPLSLSELYILAENISIKDDFFEKVCDCMAKGMLAFLKQSDSPLLNGVEQITNISYVWEKMLGGRPDYERGILTNNVLKYIDQNLQENGTDERIQIMVCGGYIQQQIRHYTETSHPASGHINKVLIQILSDICQIKHRQGNVGAVMNGDQTGINDAHLNTSDCLETLFALLVWMHFICNNIVLDQELQTFLSHYKPMYGAAFSNSFEHFARCAFDREACDRFFDIAWKQVEKGFVTQEDTK